jgi:hypothetical protein
MRNVSPKPGPEPETMDSSENGPPVQYANSKATKGANPMRLRLLVGTLSGDSEAWSDVAGAESRVG